MKVKEAIAGTKANMDIYRCFPEQAKDHLNTSDEREERLPTDEQMSCWNKIKTGTSICDEICFHNEASSQDQRAYKKYWQRAFTFVKGKNY